MAKVILVDQIQPLILTIRGQKAMLDSDLAALYGVSTKRLNEQVKRNSQRFPADFIVQLTPDEAESLRSQNATSRLVGAVVAIPPSHSPSMGPSWRRVY